MKGIKLLLLMGLLYVGKAYAMEGTSFNDATSDDMSFDDLVYALSRDGSTDRSYSFGYEYDEVRIRNGRDLAAYVYKKRKEFLRTSKSKDKKEHKKMFLQNLQQHVLSEQSPEGSESGHLVFDKTELIKISSKALVDLLIQFDVRENIQRPGGDEFYYSFQEGLESIKKLNPGMYQDCARDIMKKMFGKHSAVVRDLRSQKKSPRFSQVLDSAKMLSSSSAKMIFSSSAKLLPTSGRMIPSSSIAMISPEQDEDESEQKIDMSVPIQLMTQMLQNNNNQNQSNTQATSLINMFHSLVEEQKNQQLGDLFSKQQDHLNILQTLPHEQILDIFNRTQKVEEGTSINSKTTVISDVVQTVLMLVFMYFMQGGTIGTTPSNSTV